MFNIQETQIEKTARSETQNRMSVSEYNGMWI